MAEMSIEKAQASNMTDNVDNFEFGTSRPDGVQDQDETFIDNSQFYKQLWIYKNIPEFKIALDMRAIWTVGKKIKTDDDDVSVLMDNITGWGKDTMRNILKNMITVKRFGRDAYAEKIRDDESGEVINLKPLDTGTIRQVYNKKGILIRYEQIDKPGKDGKKIRSFRPDELFHLSNKRIADELQGVADSEALEAIMAASKESFDDMRQLMHRFVKPILKVALDEDDETKIDAFITKFDSIRNKGENLFYPKGTVDSVEVIAVPANATLNPLPWKEHLRNYFFQVVGMPQIIMGSSGEFTESTAKIAYLAFQQSVEDEQTDIEDQVWQQLQWRINLEFPASLQNDLISDEKKDASGAKSGQIGFQPSDMIAGAGR